MLRTYGPGPSLWESMLPEPALRMPAELVGVDELLDDPVFFEPFRPFFSPLVGPNNNYSIKDQSRTSGTSVACSSSMVVYDKVQH